MAYDESNSPGKVAETVGGGASLWMYKSADVDSATNATDYYTNGQDLGMAVGDMVLVTDTTTPGGSVHYVSAIDADGNATTAFAAVA